MRKWFSLVLSLCLIISLIPIGAASAATLLSDTFESATSFPSTGWTNSSGNGSWSIVTDGTKVAKQTSSSSATYIATNNVTVGSTFTYSAKVKTGATNVRNGIVARYTNSNNYYWLVLYNGNIVLNKKVSGSTSTIQQVAFTANTSTFYELKLEVNGTSVKGYVDGVLKVQGTDSSLTSGKIGFYANGIASYDNVLVTDGAGGGSDTQAPTAPTGLTAAAVSSSQINLSWNASTDNVGVTGYDVYRGGSFVKTVTGTSTSDTGLTASTTYSYTVKAKDAAGNASANSNTASATTQAGGGGGLCTTCPPSGNFDLTKWKITLPDASEVANLNNYQHSSWFYTDSATGGMVFVSPNIGGTTTNSSYTRSELREMLNASAGTQSLGNNWVTSTSSSTTKAQAGGVDGTMKATLRVDKVSTTGESGKVGRVIVGQIHGPDTEIIRLYYHKRPSDAKGAIYFGTDDINNNNSYVNIIGGPSSLNPSNGISLGQKWSYEIKVVGLTMTVKVTPEGGSTTTVNFAIPSDYNNKYLYYKAGVYNQNNTGDASDHVKATFFSLTHVHP